MIVAKRLFLLFGIPGAIFTLLAWLPDALALEIINSTRFSLSLGVLVAYGPGTVKILLQQRRLVPSEIVLVGITAAFLASTGAGAWWFAYVAWGNPQSMSNNTFVQGNVFVYCIAAILHLVAPQADPLLAIPMRRWLSAGAITALSVLMTIGFLHAGAWMR